MKIKYLILQSSRIEIRDIRITFRINSALIDKFHVTFSFLFLLRKAPNLIEKRKRKIRAIYNASFLFPLYSFRKSYSVTN